MEAVTAFVDACMKHDGKVIVFDHVVLPLMWNTKHQGVKQ